MRRLGLALSAYREHLPERVDDNATVMIRNLIVADNYSPIVDVAVGSAFASQYYKLIGNVGNMIGFDSGEYEGDLIFKDKL